MYIYDLRAVRNSCVDAETKEIFFSHHVSHGFVTEKSSLESMDINK